MALGRYFELFCCFRLGTKYPVSSLQSFKLDTFNVELYTRLSAVNISTA